MVEWHHSLNGHESKQTLADDELWQGSMSSCSPQDHKDSYITGHLNNSNFRAFHWHL